MSVSDISPYGSSPLTRGKPKARAVEFSVVRLIPAHAGKTGAALPVPLRNVAHPRSRGENKALDTDAHPTQGSSPLTRGKLDGGPALSDEAGVIPAHAGKTDGAAGLVLAFGAHPRSRGENRAGRHTRTLSYGSSPLTRGKPQGRWPPRHRRRLIPAHAGKTDGSVSMSIEPSAHPRSRGENFWLSSHWRSAGGSSPLTRGKLLEGEECELAVGLIPAHAGKTPLVRPAALCGAGSSPLTRGKPDMDTFARRGERLIPAHAGKTATQPSPSVTITAHPRSRGENALKRGNPIRRPGSSPLTREKPLLRLAEDFNFRLIPAHAGKTRSAIQSVSGF